MCRHDALYCASVAAEYYPVRLLLGRWYGTFHAEAQAEIEGEWLYLKINDNGTIGTAVFVDGFIPAPTQVYALEDYMNKMKVWVRNNYIRNVE